MKKRFQKDNIVSQIWGSCLMSVILSLEMPLLAKGSVGLADFCTGFAVSFFASLALKLLTPIIDLGQTLAEKAGARRRTLWFRILSTAFQAVMMGTCMSLLMTWWGMRNSAALASLYWNSWMHGYPYVLVTVFILINVSIVTSALIFKKRK